MEKVGVADIRIFVDEIAFV